MLVRFFYKCRYVFAVLAAVSAAALVWLWPQQPLWRSPANVGRLQSFSPDGAVLVTALTPPPDGKGYPDPIIHRWDAFSGGQLSRIELPCADRKLIKKVLPSTDGRLALVGEGHAINPSRADFNSGDWFLHDANSGRRLAGPITGNLDFGPDPFTPDGRWFATNPWQHSKVFGVYSAFNGELVFSRAEEPDQATYYLLAPNASTLAIVQWPRDAESKSDQVRVAISIVELMSGKVKHALELPQRTEQYIYEWDGSRLLVRFTEPWERDGSKQMVTVAIDPSHNPPTEIRDALLVAKQIIAEPPSYCLDGSESVAYVQILAPSTKSPDWFQDVRQWIMKYVGTIYTPPRGVHVSVYVVNRQSKVTTFVSPQPLGHPVMVSPSGRLLACATDDNGIAVWDTNPGPRWPWSVAAGFGVLAVFWLLGRVRWQRSPTPPLPAPYSPEPN